MTISVALREDFKASQLRGLARKTKEFCALLASGQINMRKVDDWQTLSTKRIDQPIDLAA